MTITFSKSGLTDCVIEHGRISPYIPLDITINQELYLTEDNQSKVVNYGSNFETIELIFKNLSRDNYDGSANGIKTWFENPTISWSLHPFTMVDEFGLTHSVRLWQNEFAVNAKPNGRYDISLTLKVE